MDQPIGNSQVTVGDVEHVGNLKRVGQLSVSRLYRAGARTNWSSEHVEHPNVSRLY